MIAKVKATGFTLHGEPIPRDVCATGVAMQAFLDQCHFTDWFAGDVLDREFPTMQAARTAAQTAYLGDDVNGVGVAWEVVRR